MIVAARRRVGSLPELRERNSGIFEQGPNDAEGYLKRRFVEDDNLDGGETPVQFLERVDGAIVGIIRRHRAGAILIVGHGGINQKMLQSLFKLRSELANAIVQDNDEVYSVDVVAGKPLRLRSRIFLATLPIAPATFFMMRFLELLMHLHKKLSGCLNSLARASVLFLVVVGTLSAQQYILSTFAGGGPATPAPATADSVYPG